MAPQDLRTMVTDLVYPSEIIVDEYVAMIHKYTCHFGSGI